MELEAVELKTLGTGTAAPGTEEDDGDSSDGTTTDDGKQRAEADGKRRERLLAVVVLDCGGLFEFKGDVEEGEERERCAGASLASASSRGDAGGTR